MPLLTLNPPPGRYATQQYVDITGPSNLRIRASDSSADPLFVRTVASSDKDGTERPYVQIIDDGLGRVILDGAFTKFYNSRAADGPNGYFANALKYLNKRATKRALILGDRILGEGGADSYSVKGTTASAFGTYMPNMLLENGYTYDLKDRSDYANSQLVPTLSQLLQYDVIIFFSSSSLAYVTAETGRNFAAARKNGVGIYFCTDHGTTESSGYYVGANIILKEMADAKFLGTYDFAPGTTVAYNKSRYGDHALFEGLADDFVIAASSSDSNVVQQAVDPVPLPSTMPVNKAYTTLKFAVQDLNTGVITNESYNYYINAEPLFSLIHPNGVTRIEEFTPADVSTRSIRLQRTKPYFNAADGDVLTTGFFRVGDLTIATYTENLVDTVDDEGNPVQMALIRYSFVDNPFVPTGFSSDLFNLKMPFWLNEDFTIVVNTPFTMEQTWSFNRILPGVVNQRSPAKFWEQVVKTMPGLARKVSQATRLEAMYNAGFITQRPLSLPATLKHVAECMQKNTGSYPTLTNP